MEIEVVAQLLAFLFGGGAVGGGSVYYDRKKREEKNGHIRSDLRHAREDIDKLDTKISRHADRLYSAIRLASVERASLRTDIEVLKQRVETHL